MRLTRALLALSSFSGAALIGLGCQSGVGTDGVSKGAFPFPPSTESPSSSGETSASSRPASTYDCWTDGIGCATGNVCEAPSYSVDLRCSNKARCISALWKKEVEPCTPSAACEKTPDEIAGTVCTDAPGSVCAFNHVVCGCTPNAASDAGAPPDGGVSSANGREGTYTCVPVTPSSCPHVRPRIGGSCVADMECDYGAGRFKGGYLVSCKERIWQLEWAIP